MSPKPNYTLYHPTDPETPQTAAGRETVAIHPSLDYLVRRIEAQARADERQRVHNYQMGYEAGRAARDAEVRAAVEALRATRSAELHDVGFVWAAVLTILSDTPETGS